SRLSPDCTARPLPVISPGSHRERLAVRPFLALSTFIDRLNERLGYLADWAVVLACAISAGNAMVRYAFDMSSNAWLEIQWYLFTVIVMLGASYTLNRNEHVRVDITYMM